jgi:hypothetical protein
MALDSFRNRFRQVGTRRRSRRRAFVLCVACERKTNRDVALMSHGVTAALCNSLKQEGNGCDKLRQGTASPQSRKPLILLAIPAEVEHQTIPVG